MKKVLCCLSLFLVSGSLILGTVSAKQKQKQNPLLGRWKLLSSTNSLMIITRVSGNYHLIFDPAGCGTVANIMVTDRTLSYTRDCVVNGTAFHYETNLAIADDGTMLVGTWTSTVPAHNIRDVSNISYTREK